MYHNLYLDIFRIMLKGLLPTKNCKLSIKYKKAIRRTILQQSFDHTENLEALKFHVSNTMQWALLGYGLLYKIYLICFHMYGFVKLMCHTPF